ncbi:hypothetical protein HZC00_01245 [Candidatus Kaiserbacteria bacterium]|nr:hypothetical protein [Candidatus Kaiserbacteria bacterium]
MLKPVFACALLCLSAFAVSPAHASLGDQTSLSVEEVNKRYALADSSEIARLARLFRALREEQERVDDVMKKWDRWLFH